MAAGATSLMIFAVVFAAAAATSAYATEYTVGDSQGWTSGVDYDTWASDKTFDVGDSLVFQYSSLHSVDEVGESDYSSCSSSNAIQSFTDQNTKITLTQPGPHYFICGTPGHCSNGMKLAINISASAAAGSISPPSSPTPSTPSAPSDSTPSTPPETPSTQPTSSDNSPTFSKSTPTTTTGTPSGVKGSGFRGENGLLLGGLMLGLGLMV